MRRTQAWENLNNPEYVGSLTTSGFYDLLITAGYSRSVAQKLSNERAWRRLEAGVQM